MTHSNNIHCVGLHCSVRNTCLLHTSHKCDGGVTIMHCTNQKRYKQDKTKVNDDCLKE